MILKVSRTARIQKCLSAYLYCGPEHLGLLQLDANGKYSPVQTIPDGETKGSITDKPKSAASDEAKQKVANQSQSKSSNGRKFDNCTEAFNAGVFNIKRSDSAYANSLDRDNDGIACEK
jgi:hypothetical protein